MPATSQIVCNAAFENDVGDINEAFEAACYVSVPYATFMQSLARTAVSWRSGSIPRLAPNAPQRSSTDMPASSSTPRFDQQETGVLQKPLMSACRAWR